jgi:hypothetical protein
LPGVLRPRCWSRAGVRTQRQAPGVRRSCLLLFGFSNADSHAAGGRPRTSLTIPCSWTGCVERRGSRLGSWTLSPSYVAKHYPCIRPGGHAASSAWLGSLTLARPESSCECSPGRLIPATLLAARGPPQSALRNFSIPTGCAWKITPGLSLLQRFSFSADRRRPVCYDATKPRCSSSRCTSDSIAASVAGYLFLIRVRRPEPALFLIPSDEAFLTTVGMPTASGVPAWEYLHVKIVRHQLKSEKIEL